MRKQRNKIIPIALGITLCLLVGFLSSSSTRAAIPNWYAGLEKPFFNPPNIVFGPVWTLLYVMMGWAVGRVWALGKHHRWGKTALYHFGVQLIFNGLWSLVFFGMQNPALALVVILILGVLIERTIKWFRLIDRLATYLLYPYFAWVCFATLLNASIWYLN